MAIHIRRQMGGVEGLRKISFHQQIGTNKTSDEGGRASKKGKNHLSSLWTTLYCYYTILCWEIIWIYCSQAHYAEIILNKITEQFQKYIAGWESMCHRFILDWIESSKILSWWILWPSIKDLNIKIFWASGACSLILRGSRWKFLQFHLKYFLYTVVVLPKIPINHGKEHSPITPKLVNRRYSKGLVLLTVCKNG